MIIKSSEERQVQNEWRGLIAIYLFLGGVGGGAYAVAAAGSLLGKAWEPVTNVGLALSFPVVIIGMLFLLSHLGKPMRAMLAMSKLGSSWISRGVWILSIFILVSVIHFAGQVMPADFISNAPKESALPTALSVIGLLFAVFTMLYTGALLSGSKGYPFWSTGVLPVLFMISGTLTGLCVVFVGLIATGTGALLGTQLQSMAAVGALLVLVELLVIFFFLHAATRTRNSAESARLMMGKGSFIFGDLILGLFIPFIIFLVMYFGMDTANVEAMAMAGAAAGVLGLIGGFLLRNAILGAGMATTLDTAGFAFRPIAQLDFDRSPIGRLPPQ